MKLYEINAKIEWLIEACVDPETGEWMPSEEAAAELANLEIDRGEKAVNVACYIKGLDAEAVALAEEEAKLRARRQSINCRAEWLVGYLERELNGDSIKDARAVIGWRKSSVVQITDDALIPEKYWKISRDPMKQAIKDAIKGGTDVPGASIVERQHIQIR